MSYEKHADEYPVEINYTFNYSRALAPSFLKLVTLSQFVPFPARRPLRYLELGYGNGVSLNIHAAASPGDYWGTDINPSHAAFARKLAGIAGTGVHILNLPFADLLDSDLPDFDVIVAHGVWSWISRSNQNAIVELVHKKLVKGGIFYLTYNALPGCASVIPLQQLLYLPSERTFRGAPILDRLEAGLSLARAVREAGGKYFTAVPKAAQRLEEFDTASPIDLCHEYLSGYWKPSSFCETAATLAGADLRFVGTANLAEHYDELNFDSKGTTLLESIEDWCLRETTRDFLKDRQFRGDVYVKGDVSLTQAERDEAFQGLAFALLIREEDTPTEVDMPAGAVRLDNPPFSSVLSELAKGGCGFQTVRELVSRCSHAGVESSEVVRVLLIFFHLGIVVPAQDRDSIERAEKNCLRFNEAVLSGSLGQALNVLASPVTGGGLYISPTQQLFMRALRAGENSPVRWAQLAWEMLATQSAIEETSVSHDGLRGATLLREAFAFHKFLPILFNLTCNRIDL